MMRHGVAVLFWVVTVTADSPPAPAGPSPSPPESPATQAPPAAPSAPAPPAVPPGPAPPPPAPPPKAATGTTTLTPLDSSMSFGSGQSADSDSSASSASESSATYIGFDESGSSGLNLPIFLWLVVVVLLCCCCACISLLSFTGDTKGARSTRNRKSRGPSIRKRIKDCLPSSMYSCMDEFLPAESGPGGGIENRHWFLIVMGGVMTALFSSLMNGWVGMLEMLLRIGMYHHLCDETVPICDAQRLAIDTAYGNGSSFWLLGLMTSGLIIDFCGPLLCMSMATVGLTFSFFGIALSPAVTSFDCFQCSLLLMFFSGPSCNMSGFQAAFVVPEKMSLIFSLYGCLMTASGAVFLIFDRLNVMGVPFSVIFALFCVVAAVSGTLTCVAWSMNMKQLMKVRRAVEAMMDGAMSEHPLHAEPIRKQMCSFEYLAAFLWVAISMPKQVLYLGTMRMVNIMIATESGQLASADSITAMSAWIIPAGTFLIPFIDWMMRKRGLIGTIQITNVLFFLCNVPQLVPELSVQFLSVALYSTYSVIFGSVQSAWMADTFGPKTMARVASSLGPAAAIVTAMTSPLVDVSMNVLHGNFRAMIIFQMLICLPLFLLFYAVYLKKMATSSGGNLLGLA